MEREFCYSFLFDILQTDQEGEEMIETLLEILVVCIAGAISISIMTVDVTPWAVIKLICWRKGHKKFYYIFNSRFPGEKAYWCGRCGYESSDEKDRRDIRIEPMFHVYSLRDFGMGRI